MHFMHIIIYHMKLLVLLSTSKTGATFVCGMCGHEVHVFMSIILFEVILVIPMTIMT